VVHNNYEMFVLGQKTQEIETETTNQMEEEAKKPTCKISTLANQVRRLTSHLDGWTVVPLLIQSPIQSQNPLQSLHQALKNLCLY